jgi:hypothetical protein
MQRGPVQATQKDNTAACLCFLTYLTTFGRRPIKQIPYFPRLKAEVNYTGFSRLIRLFEQC